MYNIARNLQNNNTNFCENFIYMRVRVLCEGCDNVIKILPLFFVIVISHVSYTHIYLCG